MTEYKQPCLSNISKTDNLREDSNVDRILSIRKLIKSHFPSEWNIKIPLNTLPTMKDYYDKYGQTRISIKTEEIPNIITKMNKHEDIDLMVYKIYDQQNKNQCHILHEFTTDYERRHILETYYLIKYTKLLTYHQMYFDQESKKLLLTMEPLQMSLQDYVQQKHGKNGDGINEYQCKLIISDILDDLWTLHKTGNIHCNLNPKSVRWSDKRNRWKITNYHGIFFMNTEKEISTYKVNGEIEWSAPELFPWADDSGNDRWHPYNYGIDLWDIGLLILYILFAKQPYLMTKEEIKQYDDIKDNFYDEVTRVKMDWRLHKLLRGELYDCKSDKNKGEIWLRNHLVGLYYDHKLSLELFQLLHDQLLAFDPEKRGSCKSVYQHKWFKEIHDTTTK